MNHPAEPSPDRVVVLRTSASIIVTAARADNDHDVRPCTVTLLQATPDPTQTDQLTMSRSTSIEPLGEHDNPELHLCSLL